MKNKTIVYILVLLIIFLLVAYYLNNNSLKNESAGDLLNVNQEENIVVSTTTTDITPTPVIKTKAQSNSYVDKAGFYVIQYTNNGFIPKSLQIPKGKSVKFINMSDKGMRIFATNNSKFSELNQVETISRGEFYTLSIPNDGLWSFYNQSYSSHTASILVY